MMFVQSLHGISHNKIEDTKEEHLELAVKAFDRLAEKTMGWIAESCANDPAFGSSKRARKEDSVKTVRRLRDEWR